MSDWIISTWILMLIVLVPLWLALMIGRPIAWLIGWARVLRQDLTRRRERGW